MEDLSLNIAVVATHEVSQPQFLNEAEFSPFVFYFRLGLLTSKIKEFTLLCNNYDGEGGLALPISTEERVSSFLYLLGDMINNISTDDIDLTPLGTVIIEKSNKKGDYLILDIGKTRASVAYSINGQNQSHWVDVTDTVSAKTIGLFIGKIA